MDSASGAMTAAPPVAVRQRKRRWWRKHQLTASCKAQFVVNAKHPPTLSVSAAPDSLKAGEASTITAIGNSDENRPLS
jgi:hypothetical protein